ncbi:MAG: DUF4276 family protein [Aquimonas sp.]|nr:DUF4276 family protein [Aquimonas sp.]
MVKVGFIVEGDSEKVLIESAGFRQWAGNQGLEICGPVINAKGGGNLLPHHLKTMLAQFAISQPDHIVILTDLEDAVDVEAVKTRITTEHTHLIFIAVKALEAWFLADTDAMRRWLNAPEFFEPTPEQTPGMPWDRLKEVASAHGSRGPGSNKVIFARKMCGGALRYELERAAAHPSCPSAKAFRDGLVKLGGKNSPLLG